MKKKSQISSNQSSKAKKIEIKASHKAVEKNKNIRTNNEKQFRPSKKIEEDYLMINGNIYKANTNS
jgi:hypothetical protein